MSNTKKICIAGVVMAMYVATMFVTQGFASGEVQIRIATSFYALSYCFPFLVLPLALANSLSNFLFSPLGMLDVVGGFFVGLVTAGAIYFVRRFKLPSFIVIPIIILCPALIVPIWLSYLINVPYVALVGSLLLGQLTPAIVGYFMIFYVRQNVIMGLKLNA